MSGKTKEFLFSPNDSASDIAKHVYDNWPMGEGRFSLENEQHDSFVPRVVSQTFREGGKYVRYKRTLDRGHEAQR